MSTDEIFAAAMSLKNTNSTGNDKISSKIIKNNIIALVDPLTYLFNFSFSNGIFPTNLKTAVVIPLFKSGDCQNLNNHRPIA